MSIRNVGSIAFRGCQRLEVERLSNGTVVIWLWPGDSTAVEMIWVEGPGDSPVQVELNDHLAGQEKEPAQ